MKTLPSIWREEAPDVFYTSVTNPEDVKKNGVSSSAVKLKNRDMVCMTANLERAIETPGRTVEVEINHRENLVPRDDEERPERGNYNQVYYDGTFSPDSIIVFDTLTVDMENVRVGNSSNMMLQDELEIPVIDDVILNVNIWGGTTISVKFGFEKVQFYSVSVEDVINSNADSKMEELINKAHKHSGLATRMSSMLCKYEDKYYEVELKGNLPRSYIRGIVNDFRENKGFRDETF